MTRVEDLDVDTLIDENTKLILTDDAIKEIPNNMTMHVAPPVGQISYLCKCSVPNSSDGLIFVKRRALDGPFLDKNTGFRRAHRRAKFMF